MVASKDVVVMVVIEVDKMVQVARLHYTLVVHHSL